MLPLLLSMAPSTGNGVVLITTRKAKKGVRRISYDFQLSSQSLGRTPDILNAQEYVNYMTEGNLIPRETIDRYWDGKTNTDWVKETFESSMMQRHNVNFHVPMIMVHCLHRFLI